MVYYICKMLKLFTMEKKRRKKKGTATYTEFQETEFHNLPKSNVLLFHRICMFE